MENFYKLCGKLQMEKKAEADFVRSKQLIPDKIKKPFMDFLKNGGRGGSWTPDLLNVNEAL